MGERAPGQLVLGDVLDLYLAALAVKTVSSSPPTNEALTGCVMLPWLDPIAGESSPF